MAKSKFALELRLVPLVALLAEFCCHRSSRLLAPSFPTCYVRAYRFFLRYSATVFVWSARYPVEFCTVLLVSLVQRLLSFSFYYVCCSSLVFFSVRLVFRPSYVNRSTFPFNQCHFLLCCALYGGCLCPFCLFLIRRFSIFCALNAFPLFSPEKFST